MRILIVLAIAGCGGGQSRDKASLTASRTCTLPPPNLKQPDFGAVVVLDVEPGGWLVEPPAVLVLVSGTTPLSHAETFGARFGDQPVEAVAVDIHGTGFTGYLPHEPVDGARLYMSFAGTPEYMTSLVYSRSVSCQSP